MNSMEYDWPDDWDDMSETERQAFFHAHRQRVYAFWRAQAEYENEREQRVSEHRVTETLT